MNIYSCVDFKNIDKIFVLFFSVYKNSKYQDKLKFYIITDEYPEISIPKFLINKLKIGVIKFDTYWSNILNSFNDNFYKKSIWCKSNLNFARFFVFEIFKEEDRFIYLDWDMIVQEDIYKLKKDYDRNEIIVAKMSSEWNVYENIIDKTVKINYKFIESKFGINLNKESFNSGFYIVSRYHFNIKQLSKLINKLLNIQIKYNLFKFGTQVIMNLTPFEIKFINTKWNTSEINDSSHIIHWCGHKKPWLSNDKVWFKYNDELFNSKREHQINFKNNKSLICEKKLLNLL